MYCMKISLKIKTGFYLWICVHIHIDSHMYEYMWRLEVNFRCHSPGAAYLVLENRIFHWFESRLVWVIIELERSPCSSLFSSRIPDACYHTQQFYRDAGSNSCLHYLWHKHFSDCPISPASKQDSLECSCFQIYLKLCPAILSISCQWAEIKIFSGFLFSVLWCVYILLSLHWTYASCTNT